MSSIIRISDVFSAEFLGSFSHSQKFHRAFRARWRPPDFLCWDFSGGQARDVGQRPTVDQVKTRAFARQHVVGAIVQYFTNSQSRIRRPVPHAVFDEYAMEALKFGPSSQWPCLG
jgi:hypothetical protein